MVEGAGAAKLYVKDIDGRAASGVDLYVGETCIGTTDGSGQISTDYFNKLAAGSRTGVIARKDSHRSFETIIVTRRAGGSSDGMPAFVQLNATPMPRAARTSPGVQSLTAGQGPWFSTAKRQLQGHLPPGPSQVTCVSSPPPATPPMSVPCP